jgi:hypothetical protein
VKNPFGWMKNKKVWQKIGTSALSVGSSVIPGGTAVGKAISIFAEVRKADELPIPGAEKKQIVLSKLERIGAASDEYATVIEAGIEAYIALRKFWTGLKAAVAATKAPTVPPVQ